MNTDKITTILGLIAAAVIAGQQSLALYEGKHIDWVNIGGAVLIAVFGYWTNKKVKPPKQ